MPKPLTNKQVDKILNKFLAALPDEISEYVITLPIFGKSLAHPFCRVMGLPTYIIQLKWTPETIVDMVAEQKSLFHDYCAKGEFENALDFVDLAYRAEYLSTLISEYGVEALYPAICVVWRSVESISRDSDIWNEIWGAVGECEGGQKGVMGAANRKKFNAMPELLTIYRGFSLEGAEFGWSWTLDRKMAEWFARRYTGKPKVATLTISKGAVLAYIGQRKESEIVIHPDYIGEDAIIEVLDVLDMSEAA